MNRPNRLILSMAILAAFAGAAPAQPPNFIIILADDQGYQDLGCFGL